METRRNEDYRRDATFEGTSGGKHPGLMPLKRFTGENGVSVTVWRNAAQSKQGPFSYYAFQLQRRYKDSQGKWQTSGTLREAQVGTAIALLTEARHYVAAQTKPEGR